MEQPEESKPECIEDKNVPPMPSITKKIFLRVRNPITEDMTIAQIAKKFPPKSWEGVFEEAEADLENISAVIQEKERLGQKIYPLKKHLFEAFHNVRLQDIKLIIIGQDPYFNLADDGSPRGTGLCFSISKSDSIPLSLRNIFDEILREYPNTPYPRHGCLESWCRQGVLMLNRALTVKANEPATHLKLWDGFAQIVINAVCSINPDCVFLLMGSEPQKLRSFIPERSQIIAAPHPAARGNQFHNNGCFIAVDQALEKVNKAPMYWGVK